MHEHRQAKSSSITDRASHGTSYTQQGKQKAYVTRSWSRPNVGEADQVVHTNEGCMAHSKWPWYVLNLDCRKIRKKACDVALLDINIRPVLRERPLCASRTAQDSCIAKMYHELPSADDEADHVVHNSEISRVRSKGLCRAHNRECHKRGYKARDDASFCNNKCPFLDVWVRSMERKSQNEECHYGQINIIYPVTREWPLGAHNDNKYSNQVVEQTHSIVVDILESIPVDPTTQPSGQDTIGSNDVFVMTYGMHISGEELRYECARKKP